MTGEMVKPENAEKGEEYWKGKTGILGYHALGDPGVLIKPNYPQIFDLKDMLKSEGITCDVKPFDVYQGPYLACRGKRTDFKVWYEQESPPEFGNFTVEFRKMGQRKFLNIHGSDVSDIEKRIARKR
ncbi:unnamed protein product [marine sediment metagenome]|uniref:Uncharacterized protein n=1 Tax=marine sediment metagenome TaxID=412755 RepID=X1PT71_9ZZZZ